MKSLHKILALLLAAAMCLMLLAACGSTAADTETQAEDTAAAEETAEPAEEEAAAEEEPAEEEAPAEEEPAEEETEETAEITFCILDMKGDNGESAEKIENAINAISVPEIGVSVNLLYFGFGDYATQVSLMISGGETLDLCNIVPLNGIYFNNMYANGQLMDISEYLSQDYASGMMDIVGDYVGAYTIGGGTYGVPAYRIYATNQYLIMRKDILEDLGMVDAAQNARSWTEIEAIYDAVLANTDLYPIGGQKYIAPTTTFYVLNDDSFDNAVVWDNLSDSTGTLFVDNDGNVSNSWENDARVAECQRLADWKEKGYIWEDSITNDDTSDSIVKQGVIFSKLDNSEVGVEVAKEETTGYPVVCNDIIDGMVTNSRLVAFGLGVPTTAEEPEAAVKFMNLIYTNADIMNILTWGIEGEDYVVLDSGEISYPDGVTADSVEYHNADYLLGNQFISAPWVGNGGDFREVALAANESAPISPYLGFALDTSEYGDAIASITAVIDEYRPNMTCGFYDETQYQDFLQKLSDAGVDDYIAGVQSQLDAFMAG